MHLTCYNCYTLRCYIISSATLIFSACHSFSTIKWGLIVSIRDKKNGTSERRATLMRRLRIRSQGRWVRRFVMEPLMRVNHRFCNRYRSSRFLAVSLSIMGSCMIIVRTPRILEAQHTRTKKQHAEVGDKVLNTCLCIQQHTLIPNQSTCHGSTSRDTEVSPMWPGNRRAALHLCLPKTTPVPVGASPVGELAPIPAQLVNISCQNNILGIEPVPRSRASRDLYIEQTWANQVLSGPHRLFVFD